ncbi:hypothetical protein [Mesonia sp. K4-1]|uniref:hypothetical protein n=1 Tax=Mesonia sp. K4-1 TaxID=2602760 RepID=UPI0011C936FA|nr:hypothetical protein [Mesonia sp. K4-1]TXK74713.1 hypothetical protein FT986_11255 [Mesonia sp. K4-1]
MKRKFIILLKLLSIIFLLLTPIPLTPIPFGKGITVPFGMVSVFYFVDSVSNLVLNFTDITIVLGNRASVYFSKRNRNSVHWIFLELRKLSSYYYTE